MLLSLRNWHTYEHKSDHMSVCTIFFSTFIEKSSTSTASQIPFVYTRFFFPVSVIIIWEHIHKGTTDIVRLERKVSTVHKSNTFVTFFVHPLLFTWKRFTKVLKKLQLVWLTHDLRFVACMCYVLGMAFLDLCVKCARFKICLNGSV